jgi:hypothetical protein
VSVTKRFDTPCCFSASSACLAEKVRLVEFDEAVQPALQKV